MQVQRRCKLRCTRWDQPRPLPAPPPHALDLSAFDLEGAIFKILTFLPFHKVYELRTVCKAWNCLLRSPAFLRAWSLAPHDGWLVMVRKLVCGPPFARELIAYEPAADRWVSLHTLLHSCPSPALSILGGPSLQCVVNRFYRECGLSQFGASAGVPGFVCFLTSPIMSASAGAFNRGIFSLLVVNLLTGSHHNLPKHCEELTSWQPSETSQLLVSMQPLPDNAYRVFLQTRRYCFPGPLEIYDSRSRHWKAGKSCDRRHEAKIASAADVDQADLLQYLAGSCTLFAYRVELDEWSLVAAQFPCTFSDEYGDGDYMLPVNNPYHLVRFRGRVFLAAVQCASSSFRGFTVWELRMRHSVPPMVAIPGADWVKVSRTPRHLWRLYSIDKNNYHTKEVKVISSGSFICMTAVHYTDTNYGGTYYPPLVYDLVGDSWYQLPSYKRGNDFIAAFALQPSFIATT